jgi:asparagine synthase (glutamine-hydrolysing)
MFAFAIWDAPRRRLFAARDRLGKKPLYYTQTARALVFASSIDALRADPDVSLAPDHRGLDDFLGYQYVPSPGTAFAGIHKLPPAHYLVCGLDGGLEVRRYWRPPLRRDGAPRRDEGEVESELLERLTEAVRLRLVSDVPLGAFLSGGIDSSAVVGLMARATGRPVKTFSIGFEEAEYDETPFARQVAEAFGTDHHEFVVRPDAASILPDLVREYGEPFADPSALPTWYLSKLTRQHVTVALSGDGGDENFGGYENYGIVSAWQRADIVPSAARRAVGVGIGGVVKRLPYHSTSARIGRASTMLASEVPQRFRLQTSIFKPEEKDAAYTLRFKTLLAGAAEPRVGPASVTLDPGVDPLDWMMWHDLQFYLPDCLMVKVDVASMSHSLEVRAPLLDHEFVEFASGIPPDLKRNDTGGKVILKRALSRLLPREVLTRRKRGFGLPLRRWFGREMLDLVRGTLLDGRSRRRDLIDQAFVRRLVDDQTAGRRDWSHRIWALLWLELWFREFID